MADKKTIILNDKQIEQRITRIAFQVYEDNFEEKEILIAGIAKSGYVLAKRIEKSIKEICDLETRLIELVIDKKNHIKSEVHLPLKKEDLKNKVIILVDDVLNSGKTLIYAMRPFLDADIKKIRTVLLVDRDHKRYPVNADFVGMTLSTTLKEHVAVEFGVKGKSFAYLS